LLVTETTATAEIETAIRTTSVTATATATETETETAGGTDGAMRILERETVAESMAPTGSSTASLSTSAGVTVRGTVVSATHGHETAKMTAGTRVRRTIGGTTGTASAAQRWRKGKSTAQAPRDAGEIAMATTTSCCNGQLLAAYLVLLLDSPILSTTVASAVVDYQ
jgi:hypothetical protein